jgi:uncharacterized membrane protein
MSYALLKTLHVLGAILLVGNIIVTAWWKASADRTRDPRIIAFAQRQVTLTDLIFTLGGVLLLAGAGYAMLLQGPWSLTVGWLSWGQTLFIATGVIWLAVLVPVQLRQARLASAFAAGAPIPAQYWSLARLWMGFGALAVLLPLVAVVLMVFKPA